MAIKINRPWWAVGRSQWGGTPFSTLGRAWCHWCKMEVDSDCEAGHDDGVYVYRRNCKRCGQVIAYGAIKAPIIISEDEKGLPAKALQWIHQTKKDRTGRGHV